MFEDLFTSMVEDRRDGSKKAVRYSREKVLPMNIIGLSTTVLVGSRLKVIVKFNGNNPGYPCHPDLSKGQLYCVIGIEADYFRLLSDTGKPYLYPPERFEIIDFHEPEDWVTEFGDNGERYSYPGPLNQAGFFEDFFDQKHQQISVFWHVVNQNLAKAA